MVYVIGFLIWIFEVRTVETSVISAKKWRRKTSNVVDGIVQSYFHSYTDTDPGLVS